MEFRSKEIKVIDEREVLGKHFRVYGDIENPLFLAKDVAEWIEHSDVSKMIRSVDEEEKLIGTLFLSGQKREVWFLAEDGLYEVLMQSRKPIAKQFKKEVKKILKQIRLTGGAVIEDREEEFINNYFTSFSDDVKKAMVLDLRNQMKKYKVELEEKSKIIKQIEISENSMLVRDVAKIASKNGIKIGEKKLYNILREWGLIFKNDTTPKQIYIDRGYFEVTEGTKEIKNKTFLYKTTKVTGKGQLYIIKRLLKEFK